MTNILLCGGSGVRLWPLSRESHPKQFCKIIGEHSLFQQALLRNKQLCEKLVVMTNECQYTLAKAQIDELNMQNVEFILEPIGRNTAPAIAIACLASQEDDVVFISPCDHYIKDSGQYAAALEKAEKFANAGYLVTFGIKPTSAETGFGYIEADGETVISFKEKPNAETAKDYVKSGKYYWNSGMFVFKAKTLLDEMQQYSNAIFNASNEAFQNRESSKGVTRIQRQYMEKIPADSIDYAVMEKSKKIKMVALDTPWSDLGSFEAIYGISDADKNGNVVSKNSIFAGSKNNFILAGDKPVVLIDVEDLVVVDTGDAILISKKGSSHKIKELIPEIENISPGITKNHAN